MEPTATPAAVDTIFAKSPGCLGCAGNDVAAEAGGGVVGTWLLGCEDFGTGRLAVVLAGLENADDLSPDLDLRGILLLYLYFIFKTKKTIDPNLNDLEIYDNSARDNLITIKRTDCINAN